MTTNKTYVGHITALTMYNDKNGNLQPLYYRNISTGEKHFYSADEWLAMVEENHRQSVNNIEPLHPVKSIDHLITNEEDLRNYPGPIYI